MTNNGRKYDGDESNESGNHERIALQLPWQLMALQLLWSPRANLLLLPLIYQCIPHQPPPLRHQQSRVPRGESANHERIALQLPWKLMALQLLWSPRANLQRLRLIYKCIPHQPPPLLQSRWDNDPTTFRFWFHCRKRTGTTCFTPSSS